jgi:hypothetical protein
MTHIEPGIQGAKRATWRDSDPRPLLARIIADNAKADEQEWWRLFWNEVGEEPESLRSMAKYWFDHALLAYMRDIKRGRPRKEDIEREREAVALAKRKLKRRIEHEITIALLEMVMPNGKPLGECTGTDCRKFGIFGQLLAKRVPPKQTVSETLTEAQVQSLWKQSKRK